MITQSELETLLKHGTKQGHCMLSVYLNVDQKNAANLNRQFELPLRKMLRDIEGSISDSQEREDLEASAAQVCHYVRDYRPAGRTLALFADPAQGFFLARDFRMSIDNQARWLSRPFVRPFLEARKEHPRYVAVLTDRAKTRLFTVFMGEVEEENELVAEEDVEKFDASGKDQMLSQMRFQRNADEHAKQHLNNVANALTDMSKNTQFDRLILGGTPKAVAELERLLPDEFKHCAVKKMTLPVEADRKMLREETLRVGQSFDREHEMTLTEDLLTLAAKGTQATTGLPDTVKATAERRVRTLVYPPDFYVPMKECPAVPVNGESHMDFAAFFEVPSKPDANVLDLLVESAAREGGDVEVLHG